MTPPTEWPAFFRLAKNLIAGQADLEHYEKGQPKEARLSMANVVSSQIKGTTNLHKVVLDLDMDAVLMPSSTVGHHHLIIDKAMTWTQYQKLLNALADAGVIETGFANASFKRGATYVRTPWTHK